MLFPTDIPVQSVGVSYCIVDSSNLEALGFKLEC